MKKSIFSDSLEKNEANYSNLTPISFLKRTAEVHPNFIALINGDKKISWSLLYTRCIKLASSINRIGIKEGETVSILSTNNNEIYESHFGVPMSGAVLNTINTRLDSSSVSFILKHGESKLLFVENEYLPIINDIDESIKKALKIVSIGRYPAEYKEIVICDFESFINGGNANYNYYYPDDELNPIALSYTSGTTGNPKGVITNHRGAYINALSNIIAWDLPSFSNYLWTLPMFHCNGWCFPWSLAANAGVSICLEKVDALKIYNLIMKHDVTHYCGAPVVHSLLIDYCLENRISFKKNVKGFIAGSSPPNPLLEKAEKIGLNLTHIYGLTEVYGPASICEKKPSWDNLTSSDRSLLNSRQGVRYPLQEAMEVLDQETMLPVPRDGKTIGEICFKGNIVMSGYLKNKQATKEAFKGGWYHTGDLAVIDEYGYVKIKDRSKDIIISGGENISSIEIEEVIYSHPQVSEVAVVAKSDEKWGEVPFAFVTLAGNSNELSERDIINFCREKLPHYKCPKFVSFQKLEKTSTGKIQKNRLRQNINLK